MSITINTNLSSLVVQLSMKGSTIDLNRAIERMTTGYKINSAKDDAAGYAVVTGMNTQLGAYRVAETNATTGLDMVSTAVNTLDMMSSQLSRLRSLAVQAQNGTYGADSVSALNTEADTITNSLNRLMNSAEYNGKKLFNGMELPAGFTPIDSPKAGASGFIDESFTRTDTSSMKTLTSAVTDGETIKGGTWAIGSVEDLVKLAELTNTTTDNTTGTTFVLSEDIDLSSIDNWTPIGDSSTNNSYIFKGTFDGNGHVIKNLKINNPSKSYQGLFGFTDNATIQNVGLENVNITGQDYVGGLVGSCYSTFSNCYVTGNVSGSGDVGGLVGCTNATITNCYTAVDVTGTDNDVGGLIGEAYSATIINSYTIGNVNGAGNNLGGLIGNSSAYSSIITNCYAMGNVSGSTAVGGLIGNISAYSSDSSISNSYASGNVSGTDSVGGLVGYASPCSDNYASFSIRNSYVTGNVNGSFAVGGLVGSTISYEAFLFTTSYVTGDVCGQMASGGLIGGLMCDSKIEDCVSHANVTGVDYTGSFIGLSGDANIIKCKALSQGLDKIGMTLNAAGFDDMLAGIGDIIPDNFVINLQIGIDSSSNSQITFDTSIKNDLLGGLSGLDLTDASALSKIDAVIQDVTAKQTELGAVQNRLDSVLDSISVQYDNLVSARSTVRDADVAKESAAYIKSQILQQASATLLATANQSPALALTLIGGLQRRG